MKAFLNMLSRYLSFPLRFVHRLFHSILQLYSRVRLRHIYGDGHSDRVAGSSQPPNILPQYRHPNRIAGSSQPTGIPHDQPQVPVSSLSGPPSNTSLPLTMPLPTAVPPSNTFLPLTVPLPTAAPSSTHHDALQSTPAGPAKSVTFQPFTPSEVIRYDKPPTMSR